MEAGLLHQMNPTASDPATDTINIFDHGTGAAMTITLQQLCNEQTALSPDPGGDLGVNLTFTNGHFTAEYYKRTQSTVNGAATSTQGEAVPFDEAQQIIAQQRQNPGTR
jgi:hypothetical protein